MSELFVSYSRVDLPFVKRLRSLLEDAGLGVWVDIDGLYAGEEFWPEVAKTIDAATVVVFVMTPDSIVSTFCRKELDHAVVGNKRIVPVCRRDVDAGRLHPALAQRQWVFFRETDDAGAAWDALWSAIRADWVRLRQQARLLVRAREWEHKERHASLLLRGRDLREAEAWLAEDTRENVSVATPLHVEYIRTSRRAATRRALQLGGVALAATAMLVIVAGYALAQRVASLNNLSLDDLDRNEPSAAIEKLERAHALCTRFGSVFSGCADAGLNLGQAHIAAGRFREALTQFWSVIDTWPQSQTDDDEIGFHATAYQGRALARIMVAESEEEESARLDGYAHAEQDCEKAAALFERSPMGSSDKPIAITRARIHIGRGIYVEALKELERASRVSDSPDIDLLLSVVHHCRGDGSKSLEHFKRYMDRLPSRLQDPHWMTNKHYYSSIRGRCTAAPG